MKGRASIVVFLVLLLGLLGQVFGAGKGVKIKTVAVMPFGTFTVEDLSIDVTSVVTEDLRKHNFNVISQDVLEDFLVKRRIRRTDFLDRPAIRAMGTVLKVDALLIGSVDLITGGENPQICMNAQMIDCVDASVIWANSVSRTGADYATFLGLGKLTSLEKLVEVVLEELLKGLPGTVNLDSSSVSPFEIIHASFSPSVLRGGETARLSLEVKEITGKVRDIKAFVLDSEIELKTRDGRWYSGAMTAPSVEGVYPLRIYISDRWNRMFNVDAMASVSVHNSPPEITLSPRRRLISPNNDDINDHVLFIPEVLKAITLRTWKVEISNEDGRVVRSEDGMGALPEGFVWRGVDNDYKAVQDGIYFCRLIVEDEAGNTTSTLKEKVVVDATAPKVAVAVAEESEEGMTLALKANDRSEIAYWELIVYDRTGSEAARFEGEGDIPGTLAAKVKKKAKKG
ncbi:MAG: hypothetical protein JW883_01085 [Deltaproteobacteria bacterium]|nr:hypothetical protein [Deltaproteobacteria bacterium]